MKWTNGWVGGALRPRRRVLEEMLAGLAGLERVPLPALRRVLRAEGRRRLLAGARVSSAHVLATKFLLRHTLASPRDTGGIQLATFNYRNSLSVLSGFIRE